MITSAQNAKVKQVRELLSSAKSRAEAGLFILEGVRMAQEAITAEVPPQLVLFSQQLSESGQRVLNDLRERAAEIEELSIDLLHRLSDTQHSQGILLVMPMPQKSISANTSKILALDNIRDPGNLGTILRSAAAFGFESIFLTPGCADPYSPKVVRAGMGAHFKVQMERRSVPEIADYCRKIRQPPLQIVLAETTGGTLPWEMNLQQPVCLMVGSEAQGAGADARSMADEMVRIPMPGSMESFNAAISASILMYEVNRQRKTS